MNREVKFCENSKKKFLVGGSAGGRVGGQGGCERRIEVFVKIKRRNNLGGRGRGRVGGGGQGGCDRRIEVFWKIHKKKFGGGRFRGGGGRVRGLGWM